MAPRLLGDWIDDSARRSHVRRWLQGGAKSDSRGVDSPRGDLLAVGSGFLPLAASGPQDQLKHVVRLSCSSLQGTLIDG